MNSTDIRLEKGEVSKREDGSIESNIVSINDNFGI